MMASDTTAVAVRGRGQLIDGSPFPQSWGALHSGALMFPVDVRDWPVKIGPERQLFIDDYLVAKMDGLRRRLHQPKKHETNPIFTGAGPIEPYGVVLAYVLHDETSGRFRLWYRSRIDYDAGGRRYSFPNLYAESGDGLHWERPRLGLFEFAGSKANNIILPAGDLRGLLHEPHDARAPWKAVWEHNSPARSPEGIEQEGYHLYTSLDGIRWQHEALLVPHGPRQARDRAQPLPLTRLGDTGHVRWDSLLRTYVCDAKGVIPNALGTIPYQPTGSDGTKRPVAPGGDTHHRFRLQMESNDLYHWSRPRVVAFPDQADWERGILGFYGLLGTVYESLWIGYLRVHRLEPWKKVDVQLMTSRDGRTWSRACDRETFLPLGPEGSWEPDYSEINHAGPLLVNDQLWFFYRGSIMHEHRGTAPESVMQLGLATLRRDGFASLSAAGEAGQVTTRPLTFARSAGNTLHVNADVRTGGSVRVTVLDRHGAPVPGAAGWPSRPVDGTGTAQRVTWDAGAAGDLGAALADAVAGPVRLRFDVQDADLYAFWIE